MNGSGPGKHAATHTCIALRMHRLPQSHEHSMSHTHTHDVHARTHAQHGTAHKACKSRRRKYKHTTDRPRTLLPVLSAREPIHSLTRSLIHCQVSQSEVPTVTPPSGLTMGDNRTTTRSHTHTQKRGLTGRRGSGPKQKQTVDCRLNIHLLITQKLSHKYDA